MRDKIELEKKLLDNLISGDKAAFCELYASYKQGLIYFAMKFLKSRDFAEDIFQDAFTSVWQNRRFIDPNAPFAPYIYTIVKNRTLNLLGSIEKEEKLKAAIIKKSINVGNYTEDQTTHADLNLIIDRALRNLTQQQSLVFNLSRKEMMSHQEIAAKLNISVNTVQKHISASLKLIRRHLSKHADIYADIAILIYCTSLSK
ncbi:DNA-directed RNA polymerase sigma-70 factor [Bacteroidales bacterium]|nr:DNA-directed RNA polymerase sigma-70 factor [Bacteroidales bacterium]